jgi:Fe-S-cluster containining protein
VKYLEDTAFPSSLIGQFRCKRCGYCCHQHGEYLYVYIETEDIERIAQHLGLTYDEVARKYTKRLIHGRTLRFVNKVCPFHTPKGCSIHPVKPEQCRTWPYWPENVSNNQFKAGIKRFCPGIR